MVYSSQMRAAVGSVRAHLAEHGLTRQSDEFGAHGHHKPAADAPLILVACSGGRDSLALAKVAGIVAGMNGLRCGAVIVDHGLQPGSHDVAAAAAAQCAELGLNPVNVMRVDVGEPRFRRDAEGEEAAARQARYGALVERALALHAAAVLVAHTQDDQVETVLIGMARSSAPSAVAGMPEAFRREGVLFLRPLLGLTRADTTAICEQSGLKWWDDPTNGPATSRSALSDDECSSLPLRSRIRTRVVPRLREVAGEAISAHIAHIATSVREDQDYLEAVADEEFARVRLPETHGEGDLAAQTAPHRSADCDGHRVVLRLDAKALAALARPIRTRVLVRALREVGAQASSAHLSRIEDLVTRWHGQSAVKVSSQFSVRRQKHVIELCQDRTHANS